MKADTVYVHCIYDAVIKTMIFLLIITCFYSPLMQKEVDSELDRLVGQEGTIHTKMLALQRMGYSLLCSFRNT